MNAAQPADARALVADQLRYALELCLKSARAVPAERVEFAPADRAGQTPLHLLQHMAQVNRRVAAGLQGAAPAEAAAPEGYGAALADLEDSGAALVRACEALSAEAPPERARLMTVGLFHLVYHWGQLCHLQTLWGDLKDHFLD